MDLIIFNPPRYRSGNHHKFNNAVLWLASYLTVRGIKARVVPLNDGAFEETVRREIAEHKPKYAAISCKWWDTLYSSTYIASLIKQIDPGVVTVAGGITANFFATELVENTDFDVVIKGDGEEPLYRLVSGQTPTNCVFQGDTELVPVFKQYVQTDASMEDLYLVENLEEILSDTSVLNSYVWTGKGCVESCVYCAANAWNNRQSFGRRGYVYRPIEMVVRDIDILDRYQESTRVTLDFDPLRGKVLEDYHTDLNKALKDRNYNCYFFSWGLPSKKLVDSLADSYNFVELCIDLQVVSDRLRKELGDRRWLKKYFSNEALEEILVHCEKYDNIVIDLSTLMGLPYEREEDVEQIAIVSDYFYDKFKDVRYPYVSPMNIEPGSLLFRYPERYEMVALRKGFSDFYRYTKRSFENGINCYQPTSYGEGVFHPLGVVTKKDYDSGDVFRVYESWKEIQKNVDRRSEEKALARALKYKKFGLLNAGIHGGIDRKVVRAAEVE